MKRFSLLSSLFILVFIVSMSICQGSPLPPWKQTESVTPHSATEIYTEFSNDNSRFHEIIKSYKSVVDLLKKGPITLPPWDAKNYLSSQQIDANNLKTHLKTLQVSGIYSEDKQGFIDATTLLQTSLTDLQTYIISKNADKDAYSKSIEEINQAIKLRKETFENVKTHAKSDGYIPAQ